MDVTTNKVKEIYQLIPKDKSLTVGNTPLEIGRYLIGRSESCDIVINTTVVSSVHAVLEVTPSGLKIFDMNSMNGTFINGEKVVAKTLVIGDSLTFGNIECSIQKYEAENALPPVLESLEPIKGQASTFKTRLPESASLPASPVADVEVPYIVYPLSADSKSDYSEYIFEDEDELYPIFKYELNKNAVEIIILFRDKVYSVDYLPEKDGVYQIAGATNKKDEVEFPYLGKTEKVAFVDIKKGVCTINQLHSYELLYLSDNEVKVSNEGKINIQQNDIVKLSNGDLEIYVRKVAAPPKVKSAPLLGRDKDLRKYLLLILLLIIPMFGLLFIEVEEKEQEPDPERIATILYRQKLLVNTNKSDAKTEKKEVKKQTVKKPKVALKKPTEKKVAKPIKNPKSTKVVNKAPGTKTAPKKQVVKKVNKPLAKKSDKIAKKTAKAATPNKRNSPAKQLRFSNNNQKTQGKVDVYKSITFKSTVSSLMAKGGSLRGAKTASSSSSNSLSSASVSGGGVETLKNASVNGNIGSLAGATVGKIGTTKGAGGLSTKTGVYTAGIPSETVVLGSMDPDVIRRILRDNIPQFRSCYEKELNRGGGEQVSGTIGLAFTIGASGSVSRAAVSGRTNLPTDVKRCVINVLKGIQFPSPRGGGTVDVKQPFNFYPKRL